MLLFAHLILLLRYEWFTKSCKFDWNSCDMLGEETAGGPNPKRVDMDAIVEVRNKDCDDLLRAEGTEWVCRSYVNDCFLDSSCHPVITDPAIIRTSFK